jgi:hypothetical protein
MGTATSGWLVARIASFLEWSIQALVRLAGRTVRADDVSWLTGPTGGPTIGGHFYQDYAEKAGLQLRVNHEHAGLLEDFSVLSSATFHVERVDARIRRFYERTADYTLDVWSQWYGALRWFAGVLIWCVSRSIEQLNLPLFPLETSKGMSSDIMQLVDRQTGAVQYTGWLRKTLSRGTIIYAGFYTTCRPPRSAGPCVKVIFPLPHGSATVILEPQNGPDGSLLLVSAGKGFGDGGFYRIHATGRGRLRVLYAPLHETFHVYVGDHDEVRTDHELRYLGRRFLKFHYKISLHGSRSW